MSLILLPIPTGSDRLDASVQGVVEEFLTTTVLGRSGWSLTERPAEPAVVVPLAPARWRTGELRTFLDSGDLLLPDTGGARDAADEHLEAVLQVALDRALRHRADAQQAPDLEDLDLPGLVICPVLALPRGTQKEGGTPLSERIDAHLARVRSLLERVARSVAQGGLSLRQEFKLKGAAVVPWVFVDHPPARDDLPAALFEGPDALGLPRAYPILHTGVARGGQRRTWEEHGHIRLLTDLYFLHGLSGSQSEVERIFPSTDASGRPASRLLYTVHSALFEYPLRERLRQHRLDGLVAEDSSGTVVKRILPRMDELGSYPDHYKRSVVDDVNEQVGALVEVVNRDACPPEQFHFGGEHRHRPEPDFSSSSAPSESRWQGLFDDDRWDVLSPPQRTDLLHADVMQALEALLGQRLDHFVDDELHASLEACTEVRRKLETRAQGLLLRPSVPEDAPHGPVVAGLGCVLALLRGVHRRIAAEVDDAPKALPDAVDALEQAGALREQWHRREASLLDDGRFLPSAGAVAAEVALVAVPGLGIGAWLVWRKRKRALQAHFEAWDAEAERRREEASAASECLPRAVNARARQVKALAVRDVLRSIELAERRLLTEVRGFSRLVADQQSLLARKFRQGGDSRMWARFGRFRFERDIRVEPLDEGARTALHGRLADLWVGALRLVELPDRRSVQQHDEVIQSVVQRDDEGQLHDQHATEATELFQRALRYGLSPEEQSLVDLEPDGHGASQDGEVFVLMGRRIAQRLSDDWFEEGLDGHDVQTRCFDHRGVAGSAGTEDVPPTQVQAVARAMAPEVALVSVLRGWRVPGGGASAPGAGGAP